MSTYITPIRCCKLQQCSATALWGLRPVKSKFKLKLFEVRAHGDRTLAPSNAYSTSPMLRYFSASPNTMLQCGLLLLLVQHVRAQTPQTPQTPHRQLSTYFTVYGPCTVNGTCVRTPNYPSEYSGGQSCTITPEGPAVGLLLSARARPPSAETAARRPEAPWCQKRMVPRKPVADAPVSVVDGHRTLVGDQNTG